MKIISSRVEGLERSLSTLRSQLDKERAERAIEKAEHEELVDKKHQLETDIIHEQDQIRHLEAKIVKLRARYRALRRDCEDASAFSKEDDQLFGDDEAGKVEEAYEDSHEYGGDQEHEADSGYADDQEHDEDQADECVAVDQASQECQVDWGNGDLWEHENDQPLADWACDEHQAGTHDPPDADIEGHVGDWSGSDGTAQSDGEHLAARRVPRASRIDTSALDARRPVQMQPRKESRCLYCAWTHSCWDHQGPGSLKVVTRLEDMEIYDGPDEVCPVPTEVQHRIMKEALALAQETLWHALHKHWPHLQLRLYPEGPETVRFGRTELEGTLDRYSNVTNTNGRCERVIMGAYGVTALRNAVCHPHSCDTKAIDRLLRDAQSLAVVVLDEKRAHRLRKLRDDLRAEVECTTELMQNLVCLAQLNGEEWAIPWPLHIATFLGSIYYSRSNPISWITYSPVALAAAQAWGGQNHCSEEKDPDYVERTKQAAAFMRPATGAGDEEDRFRMVSSADDVDLITKVKSSKRASVCLARSLKPKQVKEDDVWTWPHEFRKPSWRGIPRVSKEDLRPPQAEAEAEPEPERELDSDDELDAELEKEVTRDELIEFMGYDEEAEYEEPGEEEVTEAKPLSEGGW